MLHTWNGPSILSVEPGSAHPPSQFASIVAAPLGAAPTDHIAVDPAPHVLVALLALVAAAPAICVLLHQAAQLRVSCKTHSSALRSALRPTSKAEFHSEFQVYT